MSVLEMYRDVRKTFPELTRAADVRHIEIWDSVDDETAFIWFESLASAVNDQMAEQKQKTDLAAVFNYFEGKLQGNDEGVTRCIDVSFVENLFSGVTSKPAAVAWAKMPKTMQKLYLGFHGRPPSGPCQE